MILSASSATASTAAPPSGSGSAPAAHRAPSGAARQAASQLVSQVFFLPLLEEMRKLPFGREVGTGGRMEEVFGAQLDQRVADQAASRSLDGLTGAIAARIEPHRGLALEAARARAAASYAAQAQATQAGRAGGGS